jgi:cell division protein ZapA (FtsZ GTPase activity inhibitor)
METNRVKVNIKLNGDIIPFNMHPDDEPFYREAAIKISEKFVELQNKYGSVTKSEVLLGAVAIEAMVNALQAHENYERLKTEISGRLESIDKRLTNTI